MRSVPSAAAKSEDQCPSTWKYLVRKRRAHEFICARLNKHMAVSDACQQLCPFVHAEIVVHFFEFYQQFWNLGIVGIHIRCILRTPRAFRPSRAGNTKCRHLDFPAGRSRRRSGTQSRIGVRPCRAGGTNRCCPRTQPVA
jgi:hypothetical protein